MAAFCLVHLRLFEIARVLMRLDHVASFIINGRQVYEATGVQPVFLSQEQAIGYATYCACFRSGEICILKSNGGVERSFRLMRRSENCDSKLVLHLTEPHTPHPRQR